MTARFAVRVTAPVYHHSTDGYVGTRTFTTNIFPTLVEAVEYAWVEGAEAYACGDNEVEFFVAHRNDGRWVVTDLNIHAPNTLPYDPSQDPWNFDADVPF